MSFILDALKKSEGERQRRSGPAFFEVKVAPPRARFPAWAIAVAALLTINLALVAWFALRERAPTAVAAGAPALSAHGEAAADAQRASLASIAPAVGSGLETRSTPAVAPLADREPELLSEDDYEAIYEALPVAETPPAARPRVTRGTALGVPTYEQLAGTPGAALPDLRLDLHVFANEPDARFVFLNSRRLREGEALEDGTRVERIVPEGVVLSVRGMRFLLQRQ